MAILIVCVCALFAVPALLIGVPYVLYLLGVEKLQSPMIALPMTLDRLRGRA